MPVFFRLATFNLENFDTSRGRESELDARRAVLRPILNKMSADVLCLQEVGAQKPPAHGPRQFLALDHLLCDTDYRAYHRATSTRPGSTGAADIHNLVILSRWPITEKSQVHHDIVAKWRWTPPAEELIVSPSVEIEWDRPLLYAKISLPSGVALHVVNLHLRALRAVPLSQSRTGVVEVSSRVWAEGQFLAAQKREGQALEARLFAEGLFDQDPDALIAICGDLNSEERDMPARLLAGGPGEDPERRASRALVPLAARVKAADRFTIVHATKSMLIDHIFASRPLAAACTDVLILNSGLQDEFSAKDPVLGSLHAPVIASFALE